MFSGLDPIFRVPISGWIEYFGVGFPFDIHEMMIFCMPEPKHSAKPALKNPTAILGLSRFQKINKSPLPVKDNGI